MKRAPPGRARRRPVEALLRFRHGRTDLSYPLASPVGYEAGTVGYPVSRVQRAATKSATLMPGRRVRGG